VLDAKGMRIDMPVLSFVRGEDLRTVLIARGDAVDSSDPLAAGRSLHEAAPHRCGRRARDHGHRPPRCACSSAVRGEGAVRVVVEYVEKPIAT
jgi:hypothetical protein